MLLNTSFTVLACINKNTLLNDDYIIWCRLYIQCLFSLPCSIGCTLTLTLSLLPLDRTNQAVSPYSWNIYPVLYLTSPYLFSLHHFLSVPSSVLLSPHPCSWLLSHFYISLSPSLLSPDGSYTILYCSVLPCPALLWSLLWCLIILIQ